jgi:hypothetical protein
MSIRQVENCCMEHIRNPEAEERQMQKGLCTARHARKALAIVNKFTNEVIADLMTMSRAEADPVAVLKLLEDTVHLKEAGFEKLAKAIKDIVSNSKKRKTVGRPTELEPSSKRQKCCQQKVLGITVGNLGISKNMKNKNKNVYF